MQSIGSTRTRASGGAWLCVCARAARPFTRCACPRPLSEHCARTPQVKYDAETAKATGKAKGSIFDALEDLDYQECLDKCVAISKA